MEVTASLKALAREHIKGGLWQTRGFRMAMPIADRADAVVRRRRGLEDLPAFSLRVRSNGVEGQFGGHAFARFGDAIANSLIEYAGLEDTSTVLDIGCGVGRAAIALARRYPHLDYTGVDVDRVSIATCKANPRLENFRFAHIDVATDLYNASGYHTADTYTLPLDSSSVDVVYLVSVFTHMFPNECRNYAKEILRVLRPGGRCAVTTLLLGEDTSGWTEIDGAFMRFPSTPRKTLGHSPQQINDFFGSEPVVTVRGTWRGDDHAPKGPHHDLKQDMLVFTR
jgi:SAM-dependent methyltransferase